MAAPSTLVQRTPRSSNPDETSYRLLVMGPETFAVHPLPREGEVILGRGERAGVALADAAASRRHAKLVVRAGSFELEDLGSANGTRLRQRKLVAGRREPVVPGEAITIGALVLMIDPERARPAARRVLGHADFEGRVDWECARAEATGASFAVLGARIGVDDPERLAAVLDEALRSIDLVGRYAPGVYEVLAPGLARAAGEALVRELVTRLRKAGLPPGDAGVAVFPEDGRHAAALVDRALAPPRPATSDGVVVEDPASRALWALVDRVARGEPNVLLVGETGAGKDVVAQALHARSARARGPFVAWNCAAVPIDLVENELFGHEAGAFSGATAAKQGLIEAAASGTLFLDEIGELPTAAQAKLLRVIETREVMRLGATRARKVDVRFIAATNRDLAAEVARKAFRADLFYRLNGVTLHVPPLRGRRGDVLPLARLFLGAGKRRAPRLTAAAEAALLAHPFPGNVRELRQMIDRALLFADGDEIDVAHLALDAAAPLGDARGPGPIDSPAERARIEEALVACAGNQSRAAKRLGMSRKAFLARLDAYGLPRPRRGGG